MKTEITVNSKFCETVEESYEIAKEQYLESLHTCDNDKVQIGFNARKTASSEIEYQCFISNFADLMSEADRWVEQNIADKVDCLDVAIYYAKEGSHAVTNY